MSPLVIQNRWEILRKLDGDDDEEEGEVVKFVTSCSGEEVIGTKENEDKENNEKEEEKTGNWIQVRRRRSRRTTRRIDLFNQIPDEVISIIFSKLSAIEIITRVQYVCSAWRNLSKDPRFFRVIDARNLRHRLCLFHRRYINTPNLGQWFCNYRCRCMHDYTLWKDQLIRRAVDWSCGQLVVFAMGGSAKDDLIQYVLDNSKSLKRLLLQSCNIVLDHGLVDAVRKVPLLEEIEFLYCKVSNLKVVISQIGRSCLNLKKFALNREDESEFSYEIFVYDDREAFAIAENMPTLRHLSLVGNSLTNAGLQAILGGCPYLEYLDVRKCRYIQVNVELLEQCEQRFIHLKHRDYPLDDHLHDCDEVRQWSDPPSPDPSDDLHDPDLDDYDAWSDFAWSVTSDNLHDYEEEDNWSYEEDYQDEDILKLLTPKGVKLYI